MHPIIQKTLIAVLGMCLGALIIVYQNLDDAQAAPVESSPGVVMCVKTATTGDIDAWLCEPTIGPSFIINSVGFMQVID